MRDLAVPRAGDRSFVTGSIHGGSQSHSTYRVAHSGFGKGGSRRMLRGSGGYFLRFSHKKKTLILAHFFIEKRHAVSAVTINNAKRFWQLMSKSRSLAKISKRRLQPLFV